MPGSVSPVTDNTTDVLQLYRDDTGGLYMDIQVTVTTGTGPNPEPAGVRTYRIPVMARIS